MCKQNVIKPLYCTVNDYVDLYTGILIKIGNTNFLTDGVNLMVTTKKWYFKYITIAFITII